MKQNKLTYKSEVFQVACWNWGVRALVLWSDGASQTKMQDRDNGPALTCWSLRALEDARADARSGGGDSRRM